MNYLSIAALAAAGVNASTNVQLGNVYGWKQCEVGKPLCLGMGNKVCYFVPEDYTDPNGSLGPDPVIL